jgi:Glycoside hydrolase family 5 C-terminal domain
MSLPRSSPSFSQSQSVTDYNKMTPENVKDGVETPYITSRLSQSSPGPAAKQGFRAAEAYTRPSPIVTHGDLVSYGFDLRNCTFTLSLVAKAPTREDAPTEIFLPEFHFPGTQTTVTVSGGKWSIDVDEVKFSSVQRLRWWHGEGEQDIKIQGLKRKVGEILDAPELDGTYLEQCQKISCNIM